MVKKNDGYPCVPPARVAQLLSLGVGYEGYIEFEGGRKIFVEISPNDNVTINQQYTPTDTILSVRIINPTNLLLIEKEKHWSIEALKTAQTANGAIGLTVGAIEHLSPEGTVRFSKAGKISPHYYGSGWKGGSPAKIKTYKITTIAEKIGKRIFFIGIPIEAALWLAGEQSTLKTGVNIAFSAIGVWGGPPGWIIAGLYFGLDLVGAFDGAAHIVTTPKDPMERYTHPADATRVERVRPIDPIQQQKPQYTPREQPELKQGHKKW